MQVSPSVTCREFVDKSTDFLEGALPAELATTLGQHMEVCTDCRRYMTQVEAVIGLAGGCVDSRRAGEKLSSWSFPVVGCAPTPGLGGMGPNKSRQRSQGACSGGDLRVLEDFLRDDLPPNHQISVLEHLILGCDVCRSACAQVGLPQFEASGRVGFPIRRSDPPPVGSAGWPGVLDVLLEQTHAPCAYLDSVAIPSEEFLRWLVHHGRRVLVEKPSDCPALAQIALELGAELGAEVHARAAMFAGHVHRIALGDFRAADDYFKVARRQLVLAGDPYELLAKLWRLWGRARFGQSRYREATDFYSRALSIYSDRGDLPRYGEAKLELAPVLQETSGPQEAIGTIYSSVPFVDWQPFPRYVVAVGQNLAESYFLRSRTQKGRLALDLSRRWMDRIGNPVVLALHQDWTEGKLLSAEKRYEAAICVLATTREEFLRLGQAGQAAFVALDLAVALFHLGCLGEVGDLAKEMIVYFRSRQVSRELMAAVRLVSSAAATQTLTVAQLMLLAARLEKEKRRG